ncbi:MAG: class 1 isoprenoid biosynthesis enzyme [Bdellovibrionota bacterium]
MVLFPKHSLCFALLLAPLSALAQSEDCQSAYHLMLAGKTYSFQNFSAYLNELDAKIMQELSSNAAERPASLSRHYSYFQQVRNAELLWKGQKQFLEEINQLKSLTYNHNAGTTVGETAEEFLANVFQRTGINLELKPLASARRRVKDETNFHIHSNGIASIRPQELEQNLLAFRSRVAEYRKKYGADLISEDAELNAAYNFMATNALMNLRRQSLKNPKSLDAITLLAPLTDDAIDHGLDVKSAMQKITKKLHGETVKAETPYETVVFDFIDELLREFPPEKDPLMAETLKALQKAQLQSVKLQKDPNISKEELLQLTNRKGGLAMVSFAKAGLKDLTPAEVEYFYRLGTHAQKLDDLIDFSGDLKSGTMTLWTKAQQQEKNLDEPIQILLKSQKMLDNSAQDLLAGTTGQKELTSFVEFGTKAYIAGSLMQPKLARQMAAEFKSGFPLSPSHMQRMMAAVFAKVSDSDPDKKAIMDILQRNLLKGADGSGGAEAQLRGLDGIPGYWQLMQLNHYYQQANIKLARTKNGFAFAALARLTALAGMLQAIENPAVRGAILPILIVMVAKKNFEHFDKLLLATAAWLAYEKYQKSGMESPNSRGK